MENDYLQSLTPWDLNVTVCIIRENSNPFITFNSCRYQQKSVNDKNSCLKIMSLVGSRYKLIEHTKLLLELEKLDSLAADNSCWLNLFVYIFLELLNYSFQIGCSRKLRHHTSRPPKTIFLPPGRINHHKYRHYWLILCFNGKRLKFQSVSK